MPRCGVGEFCRWRRSQWAGADDEWGFHMTDDLTAITLRPGDEGYSAAATTSVRPGGGVHGGPAPPDWRTGSPVLVFRPRDGAEVGAAIQYALAHGLELSV